MWKLPLPSSTKAGPAFYDTAGGVCVPPANRPGTLSPGRHAYSRPDRKNDTANPRFPKSPACADRAVSAQNIL